MFRPKLDESHTAWDSFWDAIPREREFPKAGEEETWYDLIWRLNLEFWYKIFQEAASGNKILEYGCGSAKLSQFMAHRGYDCTMIDYSFSALRLARTCLQSRGLNGKYIIANINNLGFADDQFDIVYSGGVLEFFSDIQKPVREIMRVLKPGGLFAVNIVPNKWSVQTMADIERTLVHSAKSLKHRRWQQIFHRVRNVEPTVSRARLGDYVGVLTQEGLTGIQARGISPFPALSIGRRGEKLYGKLLRRSLKFWRWFDESPKRWTERVGIGYRIYGFKGSSV